MSLTIVASWGGGTSNTYVALTDAQSMIDAGLTIDFAAWTSATTLQRGTALIEATRVIDACNWMGVRYYDAQTLAFPRTVVNSYELNRQEIALPKACTVQAIRMLNDDGTSIHIQNQQVGIESYSERIGKLTESYKYRGAPSNICREALEILAEFVGSRRIVRE